MQMLTELLVKRQFLLKKKKKKRETLKPKISSSFIFETPPTLFKFHFFALILNQ